MACKGLKMLMFFQTNAGNVIVIMKKVSEKPEEMQ